MILYQVKDTAAATCGQPLIAEDFLQAKLAVGRLLSSDQDLGSRASKIRVEYLGIWSGIHGFEKTPGRNPVASGSECVELWTEAVAEASESDAKCEPYVNPKMVEDDDDDE